MQARLQRGSQSQANFYQTETNLQSLKMGPLSPVASAKQGELVGVPPKKKNAVDNKIFENMIRNQVEQEQKLRQIH